MDEASTAWAPELAEALAGTDLDGDVPLDVLCRLPQWCVYISAMGSDAYAHLEHRETAVRRQACCPGPSRA